MRAHAAEIIAERLAPAEPRNDGRQTPYRNHPVFVAQHATATCCRSCLETWHGIAKGHRLDRDERAYVVEVIGRWIDRELATSIEGGTPGAPPHLDREGGAAFPASGQAPRGIIRVGAALAAQQRPGLVGEAHALVADRAVTDGGPRTNIGLIAWRRAFDVVPGGSRQSALVAAESDG